MGWRNQRPKFLRYLSLSTRPAVQHMWKTQGCDLPATMLCMISLRWWKTCDDRFAFCFCIVSRSFPVQSDLEHGECSGKPHDTCGSFDLSIVLVRHLFNDSFF